MTSATETASVQFPGLESGPAGVAADELRDYLLNENIPGVTGVRVVREGSDDLNVGTALVIEFVCHAAGHAAGHAVDLRAGTAAGVAAGTAVGFAISQAIHNWRAIKSVFVKTKGLPEPTTVPADAKAGGPPAAGG